MALIAGLGAANVGRAAAVSALLVAAVADNLADSLSVHIYQESERLERREAFFGTLTNFAARFVICLTFVLIVVLLKKHYAAVGIAWGMALLAVLTYTLARFRKISPAAEVAKHLAVAWVIIIVGRGVGHWITTHVA